MALDWNKEINLGSLFKGGKGKGGKGKGAQGLPSKTTMNLYQHAVEEGSRNVRATVLTAILVVLGVGAFAKFGVIDQLARVDVAQAQLASTQSQLTELETKLADYDAIEEEFEGYSADYVSSMVDLADVLDLTENYVMPYATVTNLTLTDNVLTLTFTNVTLEMVGSIAAGVGSYPLVDSVSVSTATTSPDSNGVTANMTVTFLTVGDQVAEASGDLSQSDLFANLDTDGHSLVLNEG